MKYLNALNLISGLGSQRLTRLLDFFGDSKKIWAASLRELQESKIGEKIAEKIFWEKEKINPDQEWEKLEKENIKMITRQDPAYPARLNEISNPPYIIYTRGEINFNDQPMIAIVGSRKFTSYGAQAAGVFARDLARAGIIVVSGMAIGIDSFAHRGAMEAGEKTVAVLGNGLDDKSIYPRINFNLAREIIAQGALFSDYPVGISASKLTFPARNRIIAGLTMGTLVVEAGEKSGALITAELALDYNREVFSVPGSIFSSQSIGTNNLLKKGAKVVASVKDILEELNLEESREIKQAKTKIPQNKEEETLLKILSADPLHIDNISKLSKLKTATASSTLSVMEIKGWVKNIGGQNYILL